MFAQYTLPNWRTAKKWKRRAHKVGAWVSLHETDGDSWILTVSATKLAAPTSEASEAELPTPGQYL